MPHPPAMNREKFIQEQLNESADLKKKMFASCSADILKAADAMMNAFAKKKKLLICGNGGSAADAQHIAAELVIRMTKANRPALPALALTTDTSCLTAAGNDIGFENVFSRQVEALGSEGDVLIAISTSGKSENINRACKAAKERGMIVLGFLGRDGGACKALVDVPIVIPSNDTQRIQEGHIVAAHILCGIIEHEMFA
jgi:D-sedoheptulose 7-phosphate isomerase